MSNIQILQNLGADAYTNLFEVVIPPVPGVPGVGELAFRVKNVTIPQTPDPVKYEIHYKNLKKEKFGSKFNQEFEIPITFRIDKFQFVYDFFKAWKQLGANQYSGVLDEDLIPTVPLTIRSTDYNETGTGGLWIFEGAKPLRIEGFDYDYESDTPMERTVVMQYDIMNDTLRGV